MARVVRLYRGLEKIQRELKSVPVMPVKVFLMAFLPTHFFACVWRVAMRADAAGQVQDHWWVTYTRDVYWVTMTLTTVDYGDTTPKASLAVAIVSMVCVVRLCITLASYET